MGSSIRAGQLGAVLTCLMKARGITQAELARRLNISRARVWNYVHGRDVPPLSVLTAMAHELGVPEERLIIGLDNNLTLRLKRYWLSGLKGGGTPTPPLD